MSEASALPTGWTEARVELLKKLWLDGLSASQIAMQLRFVTRNAVIGKVHRLGLSGRAAPYKPGRPKPARPPRPARRLYTRSEPRAQARVFGETKVPRITPGPKPPRPLAPPEAVGEAACGLLALKPHSCRWPLNQMPSGDMDRTVFCGDERLEPGAYCTRHHGLSIQPPEQQPKGGGKALDRSLRWATS